METQLLQFGTDGLRGPDQEVLSQAYDIGEAVGYAMLQPGDTALVGEDTRASSTDIAGEVADGLNKQGVNVEFMGVITTPGLSWLANNSPAKAAVMITASHNPPGDNGIKVLTGEGLKLSDEQQGAITVARTNRLPISVRAGSKALGADRLHAYRNFLLQTAQGDRFDGMTLAVDMAHGAAVCVGESVFRDLGATVTPLGCLPNGRNINVNCGATDLRTLRAVVTEQGHDMGIAFDGDADRFMAVDEKGRTIDGDLTLYVLAKEGGYRGVVGTEMTNIGLERSLNEAGIDLHRTKVGDRYVLEGMQKTGYLLGGESSGHIIQSEFLSTGDGVLAGIQLIRAVRNSGKSLAEWYDSVQLAPEASLKLRFPPSVAQKLMEDQGVRDVIRAEQEGFGKDGLVLVRPSGTERGLVRITVQSMVSIEDAADAAQRISDTLHAVAA